MHTQSDLSDDEIRKMAELGRKIQIEMGGSKTGVLSSEQLVQMAKNTWSISYAHTSNDAEAIKKMVEFAQTQSTNVAVGMLSLLVVPDSQLLLQLLALWYDQGLPKIVMGHRYCAALMCTSVAKEASHLIKPPWRSFMIELPDGMLHTDNSRTGGRAKLTRVLVGVFTTLLNEESWNWTVFSDAGVNLWTHGVSAPHLADDGSVNEGLWDNVTFNEGLTEEDSKIRSLIGRLVQGVCLAMSQPGNSRPVGKGSHGKVFNHRGSAEPTCRVFKLGTDLKVDCRQNIKDYLSGDRKTGPVSVQTMVRGHWKMQPYGPRSELRRLIWLEPFWRGPEDAPILSRAVKVGKE